MCVFLGFGLGVVYARYKLFFLPVLHSSLAPPSCLHGSIVPHLFTPDVRNKGTLSVDRGGPGAERFHIRYQTRSQDEDKRRSGPGICSRGGRRGGVREGCRLVLWSQQIVGDVARNGGEAAQRSLVRVTGWGGGHGLASTRKGRLRRLEEGEGKVRWKRASRLRSFA